MEWKLRTDTLILHVTWVILQIIKYGKTRIEKDIRNDSDEICLFASKSIDERVEGKYS